MLFWVQRPPLIHSYLVWCACMRKHTHAYTQSQSHTHMPARTRAARSLWSLPFLPCGNSISLTQKKRTHLQPLMVRAAGAGLRPRALHRVLDQCQRAAQPRAAAGQEVGGRGLQQRSCQHEGGVAAPQLPLRRMRGGRGTVKEGGRRP